MALTADANPTKRFFIENITRDLSLEDAILDLVDNSIDALTRSRNLDVSPKLLQPSSETNERANSDITRIRVTVSDQKVEIADLCGGIDIKDAQNSVFRFGRVEDEPRGALGVYGIGLKRAVFKIGRQIEITSRTVTNGFRLSIDLDQWAQEGTPWTFPLTEIPRADSADTAGTTITMTRLAPAVALRIKDPALMKRLRDAMSATYTLFLARYVEISLNDRQVDATPLPIGSSEEVSPGSKEMDEDGVKVELFASLATRQDGEWNADRAGWYVLCNGRVVVTADKTDLTGWGGGYGPIFASKFRGFVGIAFFFSDNPASLPWTTTKRGLNQESAIYQKARIEMALVGRNVLSFLNNMYPSDPDSNSEERRLADAVKPVSIAVLAQRGKDQEFSTSLSARLAASSGSPPSTEVTVQFKAPKADVARIKKRLKRPSMAAGAVGRHTFDYFLRMECSE